MSIISSRYLTCLDQNQYCIHVIKRPLSFNLHIVCLRKVLSLTDIVRSKGTAKLPASSQQNLAAVFVSIKRTCSQTSPSIIRVLATYASPPRLR